MKKRLLTVLSIILVLSMLSGVFAACTSPEETTAEQTTETKESEITTAEKTQPTEEQTTVAPDNDDSDATTSPDADENESTDESLTESDSTTESDSESESEGSDESSSESATESDPVTVEKIESPHDPLVEMANGLANGVQAYFTNAKRTNFCLANQEMTLNYARSTRADQLVESLKNTQGESYIENTMDVFVRMTDGSVFYASDSSKNAEANLYRFGYYYYEALFEFQNFIPKEFEIAGATDIDLGSTFSIGNSIKRNPSDDAEGAYSFTISKAGDPQIIFGKGISLPTEAHDTLVLTAKAIGDTNSLEIFVDIGSGYKGGQSVSIPLTNDGEYHTYYISLYKIEGYEGTLSGLRLDPNGSKGSGITITSMTTGKAEIGDVPTNLNVNRHFHVYSDKMHHAIQFAVTEQTDNIAELGMITELSADTVEKLLVVDKDGNTFKALEGFDWADVVAVGFDVKNAGIFGYVLPVDDIAGSIKVTLEDDKYVIIQTRTPEGGTIYPSIDTVNRDKNGNLQHAEGVKNNGNDFYIGQRIYTDESHDFAEFMTEVGFERNPLSDRKINVFKNDSDSGSFAGYDAMRGIYVLNIGGTGFSTAIKNPNTNYKVKFGLRSDVDRDIYIMTASQGGSLECAALLDENLMMLPVPIEVIKNFSEATGERNLFNIDDPSFSEAIFCLSLEAGVKHEYTILNLYQNWGRFPLKQLSQIPYHCPYYHLSTGVTETNCIVPWFGTAEVTKGGLGTLPDHRGMSAPFWAGDPQHNSCGSHSWLVYYDEEGNRIAVESREQYISSYGPTYAEVTWQNLSDDGKINVTYTHMEMPQTDENRTYYTMEYEFLEDLTVKDFKNNFQFYNVTDNAGDFYYERLGYLNEKNESVVVDANLDENAAPAYVLGKECPYFSFFDMNDWVFSDSVKGYSNVSMLIANAEFVIGGEEADPNFLIINKKDNVTLTLDLEGDVTFKAGDRILINAILLPWGSQEYEDGIVDLTTTPKNYEYTMELDDGTLYMDKNVRDVRLNTLLDPLTVTSETDEILQSNYLPKVKSADGKSAEFTLSGGENNVAVHIYGFSKLTAPKVQEYVDGEWVDYVLSSSAAPDVKGIFHYYDGYMVKYDADGTYSYSFVVDMNGDAVRRFRISADHEFEKWPREPEPIENENLLTGYTDHEELHEKAVDNSDMFGVPVIGEEDGLDFVSLYVKLNNEKYNNESYFTVYSAPDENTVSGQYMVMKYRIPSSNSTNLGQIQVWTSTERKSAGGSEYFFFTPIADGQWHVAVLDLSTYESLEFNKNGDDYCARFVRVDFFNKKYEDADLHMDLAYVGIDPSLDKICELEREKFEFIELYENGLMTQIDAVSGEEYVKSYLDPSSGYTRSEEKYAGVLDYVNGIKLNIGSNSRVGEVTTQSGVITNKDGKIVLSGWCCVNGGIEKYVFSIDGGKTWLDCGGACSTASDEIISVAQKSAGGESYVFDDPEATKVNGTFQGSTLYIDLSEYVGKKLDVILAAVSKNDTKTLVLLYCFENVETQFESKFDENSEYAELDAYFGAQIDSVNGVAGALQSGTLAGICSSDKALSADENGIMKINGWCALEGGIEKYVWTADGGKTWYDCGGKFADSYDEIINVAQKRAGVTFSDFEAAKKNGSFQGEGLLFDLTPYADAEEPLQIYFCAIPKNSPGRVVILFTLLNVSPKAASNE